MSFGFVCCVETVSETFKTSLFSHPSGLFYCYEEDVDEEL